MERIRPDLQFSVLCDDVRRENNGKYMLIGLFEAIASVQFPMKYGQLHVINRWCNGQGEFRQKVRIMAPDNALVCETAESPVSLPQTISSLTAHSIFQNVPFEKPGRYWIEILLDDDLKQRYPLMVAELKPMPGEPGREGGGGWPGVG
jgi:hypothetical protein